MDLIKWSIVLVCLFILGFLGWGGRFIYKIWKIEKILKTTGDVKEILSQSKLKPLWDLYEKTFIDGKTTIPAEEFFNEEAILNICGVNTKMMRAMAGTLVGIGVFGTFLGLTIGLSEGNFEGVDVEKMRENINVLLGGMKTAFITSLVGMGTSILYTWLEKLSMNSFYSAITNVCNTLNSEYYISPEQQSELALKAQISQVLIDVNSKIEKEIKNLAESLLVRDDKRETTLGNTLRVIREQIEKISDVAQSINEDFIINITNNLVSENLKPVLEEVKNLSAVLSSKLDSVSASVKNPGENLVKVMTGRLEDIMKQFSDKMTEAADQRMSELSGQIQQTSSALNQTTADLKTFSESSKANTETQKKNMDYMLKAIQAAMNDLNEKTKETINAIAARNEQTINLAKGIMDAFNKNMTGAAMALKGTKDMLDKAVSLKDDFNRISDNLSKTSEIADSSIKSLSQAQKDFSEQCKINLEMQDKAAQEIQAAMNRTTQYSEEYVKKFKGIEDSLQTVFSAIQHSVEQYRDNVAKNMAELLNAYSKRTENVIESLASVANELSDKIEEIKKKK